MLKGFLGPGPIRVYTHDSWFCIDGAWRILNGQIPHVDFSSPLGFICYLPTALALTFSHGVAAMHWGQCFLGILIVLLSVPLAFSRLRQPFGAIYCLALMLMAIAPFSPGEFFTLATQSVFYNRMGYALLGIVLIDCVFPGKSAKGEFWGGAVAGFIIGFAIFMKFTYAGFGIGLILATIPVRPQSRARWIGLLCAGMLTFLTEAAYLHFHLSAVTADIRMLAGARPVGLLYFLGKPMQNLPRLTVLCAYGAMAAVTFQRLDRGLGWRWGWILLLTLGVDILAIGTNTFRQPADFPLTALTIFLLLDEVADLQPSPQRQLLLVLGLSIAAVNPMLDALGLAYDALPRKFANSTVRTPVGDRFTTTEFLDSRTQENWLVEYIDDGMALLQRESKPPEKIETFWAENPFPYWLQRPPIRGGTTCLDYGNTYTEKTRLSFDRAFGDADVILVPKGPEEGSAPLKRIYGPSLEIAFQKAAESRLWWLYRKK